MISVENRLIYCDKRFAVINKLPGEICSSEDGKIDHTYYIPEVFRTIIEEKLACKIDIIECVNRIDRPVSGLVLLALSEESLRKLRVLFNMRDKINKRYWAVIEGVFEKTDTPISITDYMYFNPVKQKSFICDKEHRKSKYAELIYQIKGSGERYSYLEIQLLTGRTHQIRTQLSSRNMHIRGDLKYGSKRSDTIPGIRLHAQKLEFFYPDDGVYSFEAPVITTDTLWEDAIRSLMSEESISDRLQVKTGRMDGVE